VTISKGESDENFPIKSLSHGHCGSSHAVKNLETGRVYSIRQNHHNYIDNVPAEIGRVFLENLNDRTCEGIEYLQFPAIGVQFVPTVHMDEHGTGFVFEKFVKLMQEKKGAENAVR